MPSLRHVTLLLILPLCGCNTMRNARQAQSETDRLEGETTISAAAAGLAPDVPQTLEQLERLARRYHPSVLQARQSVASARHQCRITGSSRLPQITASGGYSRSTQNTWGRETRSEARGSWSGGLGLDLLLYDFGKLDAQERQALQALIAAEEQLREAEITVTYNVRSAFFERHRAENLFLVALQSERQYAEHLEEARVMVEVGTRRQYDATKAEVDWGNARLEAVTASNSLTVAHAQLNRALGIAENPAYAIDTALLPATSKSLAELMAAARENTPSLAVLRARERAASAYVDQTIADLYPDLSLSADADLSGRGFPLVWNFSWAIRAAQTLFTGYRKTARIDDAVAQLRIARARVADAEQTLHLELVTALAQRESAHKRSEIARLVQKQAAENMDIVNEQYRVGLSSSIERTDAQVALTRAQSDLIRAYYDEQAAHARIAHLTGAAVGPDTPPPAPSTPLKAD